jgi:hypothetical protein
MAIVTSQQLTTYYDLYRAVEVTLTKDVVQLLGFQQEQVALKLLGTQWHCLIYSSSLQGAKIILNLKPDQIEKLKTGSNMVSLRYGFKVADKAEPVTFFANGKIKGYTRYNNATNNDLYFMTLEFTQRPSDDLIEILGRFLEANVNSQKRKDVRVPVSEATIKKIGFSSCNAIVAVEKVDRKCLIRDLSFGGALILIPGVAKFLQGRAAVIRLVVEETSQVLLIPGKFVRVDPVEGRRDITQAALQFDDDVIPHVYKLKINDALRTLKLKPAAETPPAPAIGSTPNQG